MYPPSSPSPSRAHQERGDTSSGNGALPRHCRIEILVRLDLQMNPYVRRQISRTDRAHEQVAVQAELHVRRA